MYMILHDPVGGFRIKNATLLSKKYAKILVDSREESLS